jgi:TonB-dependent starch-binding outer membrane protein SusC
MRQRLLFIAVFLQIVLFTCCNLSQLLANTTNGSQFITVKGVVKSGTDKTTIPGVNVLEKGTQNGTVTDVNGKYSITVSKPEAILVFSFMGFATQEISVSGQNTIDVTLVEEVKELNGVVVVGYGVEKKRDVTGSIVQVNSKQLQNIAAPQLASALQGKAAGVYVMNSSGRAGGSVDIRIRGITSLNDVAPLWVIDGVPGDNSMVNMNDIETIDIIKDASAAAIYGVKAAGGVILVTTKRGAGQQKAKISFNAYTGTSQPWRLPKMVNSDEYIVLKNEQWAEVGVPYGLSMDSIGKYQSTDWMKEMFSTGVSQNYDLNISGSSDMSNYYLGFTYEHNEPSLVDNSYTKYSIRFNSDYNITKWLKIGESLNLKYTDLNPVADEGRYLDGIFRTPPMMPVYDEKNQPGGYGFVDYKSLGDFDGGNPMADQMTNLAHNYDQKIGGNIYARATVLPGLSITGTLAGNMSNNNSKNVTLPYKLSDRKNFSTTNIGLNFSKGWDLLGNVYANYLRDFGKHGLNLTAGYEASQYQGSDLSGYGTNAKFGLQVLNQTDVIGRSTGGGEYWGRSVSLLARASYQYDEKYIVKFIVRRDGSDKFGPNNRYGVFPSVSLAWKVTEEEFMKNISTISFLKLRGGYGINGNDNIGQYRYAAYLVSSQSYPYGNYSNVVSNPGMRPSSNFYNQDIQWERSKQLDLGMELGLFKNALFITTELYKKSTDQMLFYQSLPFSSGLGNQYDNNPSQVINAGLISNKGIDLAISYKGSLGDFHYGVSANVSKFKYIVEELSTSTALTANNVLADGVPVSRTTVGESGGYFYGYMCDGIFQTQEQVDEYNQRARDIAKANDPSISQSVLDQLFYNSANTAPGDLIYRDVSGNGTIGQDDRVNMGSPWPKATYGLQINADYKWFDLAISGAGVYKRDVFNAGKVRTDQFASYDYSTSTTALTRWTPDQPSTTNYRITGNDPNKNMANPSSWYIEDGSFFRLKNISLGFTLPKEWTQKIKINRLRIYGSAQNLFTVTKYTGFDPEFGIGGATGAGVDNGSYPQSKVMLFGIQLDI